MNIKKISLPIGIFDSGIGGFSIYNRIRESMPQEDILYIGDKKYFPYGKQTEKTIKERLSILSEWLIQKNCKLIIVGCNTASVSALSFLREKYPKILFIGTVPPVKPCAEKTKNGNIGILCTPGTAKSKYQKDLIEEFAQNLNVHIKACPGLVEAIETNNNSAIQKNLKECLKPLKEKEVDTIGLGCTHFPLVAGEIKKYTKDISIIDTSKAIAEQATRVLKKESLLRDKNNSGKTHFYTTSNTEMFDIMIKKHTLNNKANSELLNI